MFVCVSEYKLSITKLQSKREVGGGEDGHTIHPVQPAQQHRHQRSIDLGPLENLIFINCLTKTVV